MLIIIMNIPLLSLTCENGRKGVLKHKQDNDPLDRYRSLTEIDSEIV